MYKILPILGDTGLGLLAAAITISVFDESNTFLLIVWILGWAYLPDVDGVMHFVRTGHFVAHLEDGRDHREGLHYPLFWLAAFVIVTYAFELNVWVAGAIIAVLFHFLHDMIGVGWGVKVFAPFDNGSYRLFSKKWVSADVSIWPLVIRYSPSEHRKVIRELGEADWIERYFCRWTPVSGIDYSLFMAGIAALSYTISV